MKNMKNIKKFYCPNCGVENDTEIFDLYFPTSEWISSHGLKKCWYCHKEFRWHIENNNYGK